MWLYFEESKMVWCLMSIQKLFVIQMNHIVQLPRFCIASHSPFYMHHFILKGLVSNYSNKLTFSPNILIQPYEKRFAPNSNQIDYSTLMESANWNKKKSKCMLIGTNRLKSKDLLQVFYLWCGNIHSIDSLTTNFLHLSAIIIDLQRNAFIIAC